MDIEDKVGKITRKYEKKQIRLIEKLGKDINKLNREYRSEVRKATNFPKEKNG